MLRLSKLSVESINKINWPNYKNVWQNLGESNLERYLCGSFLFAGVPGAIIGGCVGVTYPVYLATTGEFREVPRTDRGNLSVLWNYGVEPVFGLTVGMLGGMAIGTGVLCGLPIIVPWSAYKLITS